MLDRWSEAVCWVQLASALCLQVSKAFWHFPECTSPAIDIYNNLLSVLLLAQV
jgi:hypothetical protein